MDGFKDFEIRRKQKFDKQINSNVIISSKGLDEGVDLWFLSTPHNLVNLRFTLFCLKKLHKSFFGEKQPNSQIHKPPN